MEYALWILVALVAAVFGFILYEVYQIMKMDLGFDLDKDDD
jgi:hypothetical protein